MHYFLLNAKTVNLARNKPFELRNFYRSKNITFAKQIDKVPEHLNSHEGRILLPIMQK